MEPPGTDEPAPPKAMVEQARCVPVKEKDPALACALAYLNAGGIAPFLATLDPAE